MKPDIKDKLFPGIQSFCGAAGRWSCYAFCILKIAQEITGHTFSPITEIIAAIDAGFIKYNWDNAEDPDNLYVEAPAAWLSKLTGRRWTVQKTYTKPETKYEQYLVEVWNNAHFRLTDWESLQYSYSVANGIITSWREFTPIGG